MVFSLRWILFIICFWTSSVLWAHSSTSLGLASAASQRAAVKVSTKAEGPLIILDAGHGGPDEGAKVRQLQEKKITLLTAIYTKKKLEALGYRVLLTRTKDIYVSLPRRVSIANQTHGVLFVSIHCNAAKNTLAQGLEIYYCKNAASERVLFSRQLADSVLNDILNQTGALSRGVKAANFHVIRETTMPAILVEVGFLTNQEEWASMRKKSYLEKVASGIALGVNRYFQ